MTKPTRSEPTIEGQTILDAQMEASDAKRYWMQDDVHTAQYPVPPHYLAVFAPVLATFGIRSVFEFGCGSGRNLNALQSLDPALPLEVAGVDISPSLVSAARSLFGLNIDLGDESLLLGIPNDRYDMTFTVSVLDHLPDPSGVVRHLARIARECCLFFEPVHTTINDSSIKLKAVEPSNKVKTGSENAAPYTYLHDYQKLFHTHGLKVLLDFALPANNARSGPLYHLWLLSKSGSAKHSPSETAIYHLQNAMLRAAFLQLLANFKEKSNTAREAHKTLRKLDSNLQKLQQQFIAAEANRQADDMRQRARLETLQTELDHSLSRRVGDVVIDAATSLSGLARLPGSLAKMWMQTLTTTPPLRLGGKSYRIVLDTFESGSWPAVERLLAGESPRHRADAYTALGRHLHATDVKASSECFRQAYLADPKVYRRKSLAFRLDTAGLTQEADAIIATLPEGTVLSSLETSRAAEIRSRANDEREFAATAKAAFILADRPANEKMGELAAPVDYPSLYHRIGAEALAKLLVTKHSAFPQLGARELIRIAKLLREANIPEAEHHLVRAASSLHTSPAILRALVWAAQRAGRFADACDAIHELESLLGSSAPPEELAMLERMKSLPAYQFTALRAARPGMAPTEAPVAGRVCYVLHNSLPYSSGGYATRSQGIAEGLTAAGLEVICVTRPGFPLDIKRELQSTEVPAEETIAGIRYIRSYEPLRIDQSMLAYVLGAADALEHRLRELKPESVLAASNHVTGLPALIAAKRLGLPFFYEVRGLWEITKMSRETSFKNTPRFAVQSQLEAAVCEHADHVFTLTEAMREELVHRGVDRQKIDLVPNSCDPWRFTPSERDLLLSARLGIPNDVTVIGYIGTFVDYEGLEDLAAACAILKSKGVRFRLLLVGNENASGQDQGPITSTIREIAETHAFVDWLIMPGRVPHVEVERYYSLIDIAAFPRKPWPVCEMVSPIKPLEALAMEKAVVVSSVQALQEMVSQEQHGLIFEKGNIESLAETLERLIANPSQRADLGRNARRWVIKERTWAATAESLASRLSATARDKLRD